MSELLPCPFCGGSAKIAQCDDEGNVRGEEYESNPWSGLGYRIVHESDDCPISTGEDGYNLIYDSREEAISHWNRRAERTCNVVFRSHKVSQTQTALVKSCSGCGFEFGTEIENTFPFEVTINSISIPNYCPNCGAKVVE